MFFLLCENPDALLPTVRSRCVQLTLSALKQPVFEQAMLKLRPELEPQRVKELYSQSAGFLGQALELEAADQEMLQRAEPFGRALAAHDTLAMTRLLASMERLSREIFADAMLQWERLICQAMLAKNGIEAVSGLSRTVAGSCTQQELSHTAEILRRAYLYSQSNVGVGHLCGMLAASLVGRE